MCWCSLAFFCTLLCHGAAQCGEGRCDEGDDSTPSSLLQLDAASGNDPWWCFDAGLTSCDTAAVHCQARHQCCKRLVSCASDPPGPAPNPTPVPTPGPTPGPTPEPTQECGILNPKPRLKWEPPQGDEYAGTLTVPLSPHLEDKDVTPFLDLVVGLRMPANVSDPPVLFVHCGGPGSGAVCLKAYAGKRFSGYAILAIDQRGVGLSASPSFVCSESDQKRPPPNKTSYDISDFTSCPCALPDGTPMVDQAWANLDPMDDEQVHGLFEKMAIRARRCYDWTEKWVIEGKPGSGRKFHFLEWSGTRMLAADIEFLRTRICAKKLDFDVLSYGTAVAATYANMYPGRVGKIRLASSMPPVPETLTFAKGTGMAMTQAFAHLERFCMEQASNSNCKGFDTKND